MYLKLAVLLLFGFVALAIAVPLEDTEEKAKPAEPVASDDENSEAPLEESEAPLEESEADESENDDNQEDAEKELEADVVEDEPENEVEAKKEDDNDKRGYSSGKLVCGHFRIGRRVCSVRRSCHTRGLRSRCNYVSVCRLSYGRSCRRCGLCAKKALSRRLYCRRRKYCRGRKCRYKIRCRCGPCRLCGR